MEYFCMVTFMTFTQYCNAILKKKYIIIALQYLNVMYSKIKYPYSTEKKKKIWSENMHIVMKNHHAKYIF